MAVIEKELTIYNKKIQDFEVDQNLTLFSKIVDENGNIEEVYK